MFSKLKQNELQLIVCGIKAICLYDRLGFNGESVLREGLSKRSEPVCKRVSENNNNNNNNNNKH